MCSDHKNLIFKLKNDNIKSFISKNETNIKTFAKNNRYLFDKPFRRFNQACNGICTVYDKTWIDLMFLLSEKLYYEAEALLTCIKLPHANLRLFFEKYIENMPNSLMKLLINNLPGFLEIGGYESNRDFKQDWSLDRFKNKALREHLYKTIYSEPISYF
jgi:hypothetical protein